MKFDAVVIHNGTSIQEERTPSQQKTPYISMDELLDIIITMNTQTRIRDRIN